LVTAINIDSFNVVHPCYNLSKLDHSNIGQTMKPGKKSDYPENLFNTWLEYRESKGQKLTEIIQETNELLGRKYDNNSFYRWKKEKKTLPELFLYAVILPELPALLEYIFDVNEFSEHGVDFELLAEKIKPAFKAIKQ